MKETEQSFIFVISLNVKENKWNVEDEYDENNIYIEYESVWEEPVEKINKL